MPAAVTRAALWCALDLALALAVGARGAWAPRHPLGLYMGIIVVLAAICLVCAIACTKAMRGQNLLVTAVAAPDAGVFFKPVDRSRPSAVIIAHTLVGAAQIAPVSLIASMFDQHLGLGGAEFVAAWIAVGATIGLLIGMFALRPDKAAD